MGAFFQAIFSMRYFEKYTSWRNILRNIIEKFKWRQQRSSARRMLSASTRSKVYKQVEPGRVVNTTGSSQRISSYIDTLHVILLIYDKSNTIASILLLNFTISTET